MLLQEILELRAAESPDRVALVAEARRISFADLDADANRLARALIARGVSRGDRVVVCLPNVPEAVTSIFGALKAGAAVVPIHAATKVQKLSALVEDSGARALIVARERATEVAVSPCGALVRTLIAVGPGPDEHPASITGPAIVGWDDALDAEDPDAMPPSGAIDVDLGLLIYTSGSTGLPKGVMLTHRAVASITRSIADYLALGPRDVVLSVLPLSFGYGFTQLLPTFLAGASLVLERSMVYPRRILERMVSERVTGLAVVPTIATLLLQHDLRSFDLSALRYLTNAGAAIPPSVLAALRESLPGTRIFPMYGQTECIRASYLPPEEVDARPASVGRGLANQEVWVADEQGQRLPPGSRGELVVRGSHLMIGYWNRPEETARKLRPGPLPGERVLYTGDLFQMDEDGYLYFIARMDDIIKTRGEKVSPREVEDVLASFDGVHEVAVIGVRDPILGAALKAFVVAGPGVQLESKSLLRHCAERLDDFAVPKRIELLGELPRSANEKIDKQALRQREEAT